MDEKERFAILGFVPQKEIIYDKYLPYVDKLDHEAQQMLHFVKTSLGRAMLNQNLDNILSWIKELHSYLKVFGMKFSKEDHLNFIKVFFELLVIPDLELSAVNKIISILFQLIKKHKLLSRDDLVIQWRPLYELYEKIMFSSAAAFGTGNVPSNFEKNLRELINISSKYFTLESTQEILDEFRPMMCPYSVEMSKAMSYLKMFLCTALPPSEHHRGFKLWFDEFITLWSDYKSSEVLHIEHDSDGVCEVLLSVPEALISLFAKLAEDNIGYIDWEPYIPLIFTRVLRGFNLPYKGSMIPVMHTKSTETLSESKLIACMLGGGSSCQLHINRLFKTLESFFHPSNFGRWLFKMQRFLHRLPAAVVRRIHRERYQKPSWRTSVPEEAKLTNQDITNFVNSMVPCVMLSMFSKRGSGDSAAALRSLCVMRPELTLPQMLERLYSSLETLTEPHRLLASLNCIVAGIRSLVAQNKFFPDGPKHVIPLLMAALPGIDPNDYKKSLMTFQFMGSLMSLVLLVDCSPAANNPNISEDMRELCSATAAFEDFVMQLMDKLFALISNLRLNNPSQLDREAERINYEENILEYGVQSTMQVILEQSSPQLYDVVLDKMRTFVMANVFETNLSGKFVANMVRAACKIAPDKGLKVFVPHFSKLILSLTETESTEMEDDELLFSLLIFTELAHCTGDQLIHYQSYFTDVLKRTLHLKCKKGSLLAATLLQNNLKTYLSIYVSENSSVPRPWTEYPPEEMYHYIEMWGKPGNVNDLQAKFHTPSDAEVEMGKYLLETFLFPELEKLQNMFDTVTLTREEALQSLQIVTGCLSGSAISLPMWDEEQLVLFDSSMPDFRFHKYENGAKDIDINGQNIRLKICDVARKVLRSVLEHWEDDVKILLAITKLFNLLIFNWGVEKARFDSRFKQFKVIKEHMGNKMIGQKQQLRHLLVDRVEMQHHRRTIIKYMPYFSNTHYLLLKDLLKLSTSHYSNVRKQAQLVLQQIVTNFEGSHKLIRDDVLLLLKTDPTVNHEEFKGILHVVLGQAHYNLLSLKDWVWLSDLWPLIVSSKHSEKPSIVKLLDSIKHFIKKHPPSFQIKIEFPESSVATAKNYLATACPSLPSLTDADVSSGAELLKRRNEENERCYLTVVQSIVNLINDGSLHWRHYQLGCEMLSALLRMDVPFPEGAAQLFVSHLFHDTLAVRKLSLEVVHDLIKNIKRRNGKITIDPVEENRKVSRANPLFPDIDAGNFPDGFWLQYNSMNLPDTEEKWNARHFVHKPFWGYYTWPKELKVHAPDASQPKLDRSREELSKVERIIYDTFSDPTTLDKIFFFLSMEEKKGLDKFDHKRHMMWRVLFLHFGDMFLPLVLERISTMVEDKQESVQRAAAECICGIISGSKHWDFKMMHRLKDQLLPILEKVMHNITPESLGDWTAAFSLVAENKDPNKYYWLVEFFLTEPPSIEKGSFLESSWLFLLCGILIQFEWKAMELYRRVLEYIKSKLNHSYQNVRDKLSTLLIVVFMFNFPLNPKLQMMSPDLGKFIDELMPSLAVLENNIGSEGRITEDTVENKEAKNLLRTVCRFMQSFNCVPPEFLKLMPLLCYMMHDTSLDGVQQDCKSTLFIFGTAQLDATGIEVALSTIQEIISCTNWHSRVSALTFLQQMVFQNLFMIMCNESWSKTIFDIVLKLLQDESVEVRESAADALCGFLHCEFVKISEDLINLFKAKCQKKLRKSKGENGLKLVPPDEVRERHAAILGLCSCVNAFPYDVPEFLPDIIFLLGDHLNYPQPISATIKKTLSSFRRTHHDNWRDHKQKFTDDQLTVLTDLLVSPSYYA